MKEILSILFVIMKKMNTSNSDFYVVLVFLAAGPVVLFAARPFFGCFAGGASKKSQRYWFGSNSVR